MKPDKYTYQIASVNQDTEQQGSALSFDRQSDAKRWVDYMSKQHPSYSYSIIKTPVFVID